MDRIINLKLKCNRNVDSILLKYNVAREKAMNEAMKRRYKIKCTRRVSGTFIGTLKIGQQNKLKF